MSIPNDTRVRVEGIDRTADGDSEEWEGIGPG